MMLSSFSKLTSSRDPLLFDIRLKSTEHDVLLLKGKANEASSVLLAGTVVLSLAETMQIRNLSLRLVGKLRLNLPSKCYINGVNTKKYVKYEKRIYSYKWDSFNFELDNDTNSDWESNNDSNNTLSLPKRNKSSSSLMSLGKNSNGSQNVPKGNYEFPFNIVLPGTITESVEGLPNASVIYKLEAVLERSNTSDYIRQKPLRIVRTLRHDAVELSETVAVDNRWPKKVEYSISVPAKAIAVGSAMPIYIMIVPLLKGLKLGNIKVTLLETSQYLGNIGGVINQDRIVSKMKVKDPLGHMALINKRKNNNNDDDTGTHQIIDFQDRWEIDTLINVPASLSKCTQDCDIYSNIKVRHKLKFSITLINPDGHLSELRASLPIQLFISPFVTVGVKNTETLEMEENWKINKTTEEVNNPNPTSFSSETFFNNDKEDEDVIFATGTPEVELHAGGLENNFFATTAISELMTPPNYGKHVYDRLWNDVSVSATPLATRPSTPIPNSLSNSFEPESFLSSVNDHLANSFNDLSILRDSQATPVYLNSTNPFRDAQFPTFAANSDSETQFPVDIPQSPALSVTYDHISRVNSVGNIQQSSSVLSLKKLTEQAELTKLPTYDRALKSDLYADDLPPPFPLQPLPNKLKEPIPIQTNGFILEKPASARHRSSSFLSVASRQRSHISLNRSNNSSNTSLNLLAKNDIGAANSGTSNFLVPNSTLNTSPSVNKLSNTTRKSSFNMTHLTIPIIRQPDEKHVNASTSTQRSLNNVSVRNRQRSTTLPSVSSIFSRNS